MQPTLDDLRRYAVARSLFAPTSLPRAIHKLGFVQADPIRAPARAQDLILRHRVANYRAGDLERRYRRLPIEEDFFVNYGFMPRDLHERMHPRRPAKRWPVARQRQAQQILEFIAKHGATHPSEIDRQFGHGRVVNWFGGTSRASTQIMDEMHYRGLLRVSHRDNGTRVYAAREQVPPNQATAIDPRTQMDSLLDAIVHKYAPLPAASLGQLASYLRRGVPQFAADRAAALTRARDRLASGKVGGVQWFWPADENPRSRRWRVTPTARLLAPFDPIVWDRRRFALFWGWTFRFEAYTPPAKRKLGYYALPLLWQDQVVGWGNVTVRNGALAAQFGYVAKGLDRNQEFQLALDAELDRLRVCLALHTTASA
jgi:uncharacterized protein